MAYVHLSDLRNTSLGQASSSTSGSPEQMEKAADGLEATAKGLRATAIGPAAAPLNAQATVLESQAASLRRSAAQKRGAAAPAQPASSGSNWLMIGGLAVAGVVGVVGGVLYGRSSPKR